MKLIALNPTKKRGRKKTAKKTAAKKTGKKKPAKKTAAKKKGATMAKKKTKTPAKRRPRKNPSVKRTVRRARRAVGVLGPIEDAAKDMLPMSAGMLGAKVVQRKFGNGHSELEEWDWKDYLMGGLGTLATQLGAKHILRVPAKTQKEIIKGGMFYLLTKAVLTELVPLSDTAKEWLGEDGRVYKPGDTYVQPQTGETFVLGESGDWAAQSNMRQMVGAVIDDEESEVLLGEGVTPVTALGEGVTPVTSLGALPAYPQGIF